MVLGGHQIPQNHAPIEYLKGIFKFPFNKGDYQSGNNKWWESELNLKTKF